MTILLKQSTDSVQLSIQFQYNFYRPLRRKSLKFYAKQYKERKKEAKKNSGNLKQYWAEKEFQEKLQTVISSCTAEQ